MGATAQSAGVKKETGGGRAVRLRAILAAAHLGLRTASGTTSRLASAGWDGKDTEEKLRDNSRCEGGAGKLWSLFLLVGRLIGRSVIGARSRNIRLGARKLGAG